MRLTQTHAIPSLLATTRTGSRHLRFAAACSIRPESKHTTKRQLAHSISLQYHREPRVTPPYPASLSLSPNQVPARPSSTSLQRTRHRESTPMLPCGARNAQSTSNLTYDLHSSQAPPKSRTTDPARLSTSPNRTPPQQRTPKTPTHSQSTSIQPLPKTNTTNPRKSQRRQPRKENQLAKIVPTSNPETIAFSAQPMWRSMSIQPPGHRRPKHHPHREGAKPLNAGASESCRLTLHSTLSNLDSRRNVRRSKMCNCHAKEVGKNRRCGMFWM
jgi:hypothetical protein